MSELQSFDKLKSDVTLFVEPVFTIQVKDHESMKSALEVARSVKSYSKQVEEKRKELVGPLNDRVKTINEYAKKIAEPLLKAEDHLKKTLRSYELVLEQVKQQELKRLEEEKKRKQDELEARLKAEKEQQQKDDLSDFFKQENQKKVEEIQKKVEEDRQRYQLEKEIKQEQKQVEQMGVSGARKVWTFKVVDLSKIPREFLSLDETRVRQAIKSGSREIQGIEIYQETTIAVR